MAHKTDFDKRRTIKGNSVEIKWGNSTKIIELAATDYVNLIKGDTTHEIALNYDYESKYTDTEAVAMKPISANEPIPKNVDKFSINVPTRFGERRFTFNRTAENVDEWALIGIS